jgi:hypothetical protein
VCERSTQTDVGNEWKANFHSSLVQSVSPDLPFLALFHMSSVLMVSSGWHRLTGVIGDE